MGNWNFNDKELAITFDTYVRDHVHYYNDIVFQTLSIAKNFINSSELSTVLDYGCGSGEMLSLLRSRYPNIHLIGVDNSEEMLKAAGNTITVDKITTLKDNMNYVHERLDFVVMNLVLQFNPYASRFGTLESIVERCKPGAGVLITEKVKSEYVNNSEIHRKILHKFKLDAGVRAQEILEKDESISGVLRPLTIKDNIKLMRSAGLTNVEVMFKFGEFTMFLGTK